MAERIAEVGYINSDMEHALISIYEPALLNDAGNGIQVAITIESALQLHAELNRFLGSHGITVN